MNIVMADPTFDGFDVMRAEWYTTLLSGDSGLDDGAHELARCLSSPLDGLPPALATRQLVFVCHSMGGLVVRQALVQHPELTRGREISVLTYGTPAKGVALADRLDDVARALGHRQLLDLSHSSPVLAGLHERFTELVQGGKAQIDGLELVESDLVVPPVAVRRLARRFMPHSPPVVGVETQGGYFGPPVVLPWTDHRSISRPTSPRHPSHTALRRFVRSRG